MAILGETRYSLLVERGRMDSEYHSHNAWSLERSLRRSGLQLFSIRNICTRITSGHTPLRHDLTRGDVDFLTVECVSPLSIHLDLAKRVEHRHYVGELARVALEPEAVVVTIKRRICQASPCYAILRPTVVNQDIAVLRLRAPWKPGYVATYLCSRLGQGLADRERTEQMNPYLPVGLLGSLLIPYLPDHAQDEIDRIVRDKLQKEALAARLYREAEEILSGELGLGQLDLSHPVGHEARLSEVRAARRFDGGYFMPRYRQLHGLLSQFRPVRLGTLCCLTKGIEVGSAAYVENGILFVRVSTLTPFGVRPGPSEKYISHELYELLKPNFKPCIGEILLSKDGTPGIAHLVDREIEGIISGGIVRLSDFAGIDPAYLEAVINSQACQLQIKQEGSGALIAHWKTSKIMRLLIPRLGETTEERIAELVRRAKETHREAAVLLETAKRRVEELIEQEAAA